MDESRQSVASNIDCGHQIEPEQGEVGEIVLGQFLAAKMGMETAKPAEASLTSGRVRPLAEDRTMNRPFTFDAVFGQSPPNLSGNPAVVQAWLDGENFLQVKGGRLQKVNAVSGRAQPFFDPDRLAQGLATLPGHTQLVWSVAFAPLPSKASSLGPRKRYSTLQSPSP